MANIQEVAAELTTFEKIIAIENDKWRSIGHGLSLKGLKDILAFNVPIEKLMVIDPNFKYGAEDVNLFEKILKDHGMFKLFF